MSGQAGRELLLDAIGRVRDEYVLEAHEDDVTLLGTHDADNGDGPVASGEPRTHAAGIITEDAAPAAADAADADEPERVGLTVMPGGRNDATRGASQRGTNFVSIMVLLGIAASLSGVFLIFRGSVVDWLNGQLKAFNSSASYSMAQRDSASTSDSHHQTTDESHGGTGSSHGTSDDTSRTSTEPPAAVWLLVGAAAFASAALFAHRARIAQRLAKRRGMRRQHDAPDADASANDDATANADVDATTTGAPEEGAGGPATPADDATSLPSGRHG